MTAQTLYLAMVLAAFVTFLGVLGGVSVWSRVPPSSAARAPRLAGARRERPVIG